MRSRTFTLSLAVAVLWGPCLTRADEAVEPTAKTVDELKKLNLPAGVDITIKI